MTDTQNTTIQFTTERDTFRAALASVKGAIDKRTHIPILANVLLTADDGLLAVTATDMNITVRVCVDAQVQVSGSVTVSACLLYDMLNGLPKGSLVELDAGESDTLRISAGPASYALPTLPVEDMPVAAAVKYKTTFDMPASELLRLIDRTRFAMSCEDTRYYLNGLYLHRTRNGHGQDLSAVATDGHRLAKVDCRLPGGAAGMPGVIVPSATVNLIRKLIAKLKGDVVVSVAPSRVRVTFVGVEVISKTIDGTYPEYERVIPKDNHLTARLDTAALAGAMKRLAAVFDRGTTPSIKFTFAGNSVALVASSHDNGSAAESLEVEYDGEELEIGFNGRDMADICNVIGGDTVELSMSDSVAPVTMRGSDDPAAIYVQMPLRV